MPKARSVSLSLPSAAFPSVLLGFIAFHLLSHLYSEHFCPCLFVLGLFQGSQRDPLGSGSTFHPPCSPTDRRDPAGCSVMLPQTIPSALRSHTQECGCLRDRATLHSRASGPHPRTARETEARDTPGGALEPRGESVSLGTSPGMASLGSRFPPLGAVGLGTWGDVAGDRRPTRAAHTRRRHGNRRCPRTARPATCFTFPALFPGLPAARSHPGDANAAATRLRAAGAAQLLLPYGSSGSSRREEEPPAPSWDAGGGGETGVIRQPGVGKIHPNNMD